jgi:hypothetical protein
MRAAASWFRGERITKKNPAPAAIARANKASVHYWDMDIRHLGHSKNAGQLS